MKLDPNSTARANRLFYDLVADVYEQVDGRRTAYRQQWLIEVFRDLRKSQPRDPFLEIGCGTGWLLNAAKDYYPIRYGCDVSPVILKHAAQRATAVACAASEYLPFADNSFRVVAFFATLHHLFNWRAAFTEAHRVLKPGGLLYCDHDLSAEFVSSWRPFVSLYRAIRRPYARYSRACPKITPALYKDTEFHEKNGVSGKQVAAILENCGFSEVDVQWHWMGLNSFFDAIGRIFDKTKRPGRAPLLRVIAQKTVS